MAKKPSSGSKRSKRPVAQSAVKGGGIMSLNKSNTSPFMKAVIILIIISMVMLFLYGGITGIIDLFKTRPQAARADALTTLKARFDPQIASFNTALASNPASYTLLVAAGNRHFDYALELDKLASTGTTSAAPLAAAQWSDARDAFKKAVKANKQAESGVLVDYSIATYYSLDTTGAVNIVSGVIKKDPAFAPAYFNLGIYYESLNNNVFAIAAFQKYLSLNPPNATSNIDFAKKQLQQMGAPVTAGGGSAITTGSAPTTP